MLSRYVSETDQLKTELIESLSGSEVEALQADCASLGTERFAIWFFENLTEIEKFVHASPSQRGRRKAWANPALKSRMILGGVRYLTGAHNLLSLIEENSAHHQAGHGYRDMAVASGNTFWKMWLKPVPDWPIEWGESPFWD